MWFKAKNIYLSLSTVHGGSESQSRHNITTSMRLFNSLCRYFWISVVSLSQTSLHTHSHSGPNVPWQRSDRSNITVAKHICCWHVEVIVMKPLICSAAKRNLSCNDLLINFQNAWFLLTVRSCSRFVSLPVSDLFLHLHLCSFSLLVKRKRILVCVHV